MKRNLLFPLAVLLFFSTNVKAQEIHEASVLPYVPNFIPTAYTQGGKVLFFTVEGGSMTMKVFQTEILQSMMPILRK